MLNVVGTRLRGRWTNNVDLENMVILCTMLNAETSGTRGTSAENRNGAGQSTSLSPSSSTGEEDRSV